MYQTQQKEGIAAFLSSNGFVTFDMVRCVWRGCFAAHVASFSAAALRLPHMMHNSAVPACFAPGGSRFRRKAGVSQPKPWLEAAHPSAVLLDTAMVAPSLIQQANAALEEAVADAGWADVASLIPDELSADAPQLLPRCPCVAAIEKEGGAVFAGSCLVRSGNGDFLFSAAIARGLSVMNDPAWLLIMC